MASEILRYLWTVSWQVAAVTAIVWLVTRLSHRAPACWRHALWLIVIAKLFVPPFIGLPASMAALKSPPVQISTTATAHSAFSQTAVYTEPNSSAGPNSHKAAALISTPPAILASHLNIIAASAVALWVIGAVIMLLQLIIGRFNQHRLLLSSFAAGKEFVSLLDDCARQMQIHRAPRLRCSHFLPAPMIIGLLHPVILLPADMDIPEKELAAIFLHELAHMKRRDMAALWLQQLARVLFFFHPAVYLAEREIRREREIACDELVLSHTCISRSDYAAGYMSAIKLSAGNPISNASLAMAEPFEVEKRRLIMIYREALPKMSIRWLVALLAVGAVILPSFATVAKLLPKPSQAEHKQFVQACSNGDLRTVRSLLVKRSSSSLLNTTVTGRPPLVIAINRNHTSIAKLLIDKGADVNTVTSAGSTPLMSAAARNAINTATLLIKKGANVNAQNNYRQTALTWAALYGDLRMVRLLVTSGADVRAKLSGGQQILHVTAAYGHPEVADYLISAGANVNARDDKGDTPLAVALAMEKKLKLSSQHPEYRELAGILRSHSGHN